MINAKRRLMARNPFTNRMILDIPSSWARVRRRYNATPGELRDRRQQTNVLTNLHGNYAESYQRFINNDADFDLGNQIANMKNVLNLFIPQLQNGERFLMKLGELNYTLALEKYEDLMKLVISKMENNHIATIDPSAGSDSEIVSNIEADDMTVLTITRPSDRVGERPFTRNSGEFSPYIHDFEDEELCKDLALLGCWSEVTSDNYKNNCLLLALKPLELPSQPYRRCKLSF